MKKILLVVVLAVTFSSCKKAEIKPKIKKTR